MPGLAGLMRGRVGMAGADLPLGCEVSGSNRAGQLSPTGAPLVSLRRCGLASALIPIKGWRPCRGSQSLGSEGTGIQ